MLATYGLMGGVDNHGHVSSGYKGEKFNQSHVELAQALCLRVPFAKCSREFPSPDTIQQLFDLLPEVGKAYSMRRFVQLQEERSDENKAVMLIQEELRLHTQAVRSQTGYQRRPGQYGGRPTVVAPNYLDRQFDVTEPNKMWVTDITYIRTHEGWLYPAAVLDLFSRQVVGWSMGARIDRELALNALLMAVWRRRPETEVLVHSDQGSQFSSHD